MDESRACLLALVHPLGLVRNRPPVLRVGAGGDGVAAQARRVGAFVRPSGDAAVGSAVWSSATSRTTQSGFDRHERLGRGRAGMVGSNLASPIPTPKSDCSRSSSTRPRMQLRVRNANACRRAGRDRQEPRRLCRTSLPTGSCGGLRATCREVGEIRTRPLRPDPGRRVRPAPGKVRAVRRTTCWPCEVVTADGHVLDVSDHDNADLFWGVARRRRDFGVVTSFTYRPAVRSPRCSADRWHFH